jgi:hypothetical protein
MKAEEKSALPAPDEAAELFPAPLFFCGPDAFGIADRPFSSTTAGRM